MKILFIINDPPYGTERCFNALRLALALLKEEQKPEINVFLMADAVLSAKTGQKTPDGYYNLGQMIKGVTRRAEVVLCGTCMDARGIDDSELIAGATPGTMPQLAQLTLAADILGTHKTTHELMAECIMDMGDKGAHLIADPVRPPRNVSDLSSGKRWLWAKRFFSNYYLWKLRRGINRSPRWVW